MANTKLIQGKLQSVQLETAKIVAELNKLKSAGTDATQIYTQMSGKIKAMFEQINKASKSINTSFSKKGVEKEYIANLKIIAAEFRKIETVQNKVLRGAAAEESKVLKRQQNLRNKIAAQNKQRTKQVSDFETNMAKRRAAVLKSIEKRKSREAIAETKRRESIQLRWDKRRDANKKTEVKKFIAAEKQKTAAAKTEQKKQEAEAKSKDFKGGFTSQFGGRAIGGALGSLTKYLGIYRLMAVAGQAFNSVVIGSAKAAVEFEKSLARLSAVAGATSSEVEQLSKNAFDVAGSTKYTATEIVGLQIELSKLGFTSDEVVKSTLAIANAAAALGSPLEATAAIMGKVRNQFNLLTEEIGYVSDVIVTAVNESALSFDTLGVALQYVGPIAENLGLSFAQTTAAMAKLADSGFTASRIGTGLRAILTEIGSTSADVGAELSDLAAREISLAEAVELVGKRNAAQLITLLKNIEVIENGGEAYNEQGRAAVAAAKSIDTVSGQLALLNSAYEKIQVSIGQFVIGTDLVLEVLGLLSLSAVEAARATQILAKQGIESLNDDLKSLEEGGNIAEIALARVAKQMGITVEELKKQNKEADNYAGATAIAAENTGIFGNTIGGLTGKLISYGTAWAVTALGITDADEAMNGWIDKLKEEQIERAKSKAITEGTTFANSIYGASVDALVASARKGNIVNTEAEALNKEIDFGIKNRNNTLKTSKTLTDLEILSIKAEVKQYEALKQTLINLQVTRDEINSIEKKRLNSKLSDISDSTKAEVDAINELAKQQTATATSADAEALIEANRLAAVSTAYRAQASDIRLLGSEFKGFAEEIEKAAEKADSLGVVLGSEIIEKVTKVTKDYADEIENLKGKLESGEITQDQYNAARDAQYDALKNNIDQFKELGDISPEVAAFFDKIAKAALEAGYAINSVTVPDAEGWEKFAKDLEEGDYLDVIGEVVSRTGEVLGDFSDAALENTKNRIASELEEIKNRYEVEDFLAKQQFENGLINEEQYRRKQSELRKKQVKEENKLGKELFEAERKQERQSAITDAAVATGDAIIGAIADYGFPAGLGIGALLSTLVAGQLAGQLGAISSKKFYPKSFAVGGIVNGPSHDQGGVPFTVQGQGGYEMEGGEFIVNKKASSLHRQLLESINNSVKPNTVSQPMTFATGGTVSNTTVNNGSNTESVNYLKAIAEATTSSAIQSSKPLRAFVTSADLRKDELARRIKQNNTTV
tara:strand:- start:1706 stop:5395 length:3690 start_codon:yes stop_codon:yes gene_type:complete